MLGRERIMDASFLPSLPPDIDPDVRNVHSVEELLSRFSNPLTSDSTYSNISLPNEQKVIGFTLICSALNK